jgi:hypothetical protein
MCRGAVSGGTGHDHMRSTADTASERRRRAEVVVAAIVMARRYSGHRQSGQARRPSLSDGLGFISIEPGIFRDMRYSAGFQFAGMRR